MQPKISLKWPEFIVGILGIAFFAIIFSFAKPISPADSKVSENLIAGASAQAPGSIGLPMRLTIPAIDVDAPVQSVGLTSGGAMDVPKGPVNVAWFKLGPRPGEKGSAVITGHFGWLNGEASVFDNLHKLRKGDKVYVEDNQGVIVTFVVVDSRLYDPNANAADVFGSNDGKAHLNLVTCEGVWDPATAGYSKRRVVFTDIDEK